MKITAPITIGILAKESGVGVETVRFYERKGLVTRPTARASGYRHYQADDVTRIRFIKRAQDLGFTLKEIRDLLELNVKARSTCSDVKTRADRKRTEVEGKIKDLQRMKKTLKNLSDACGDGRKAAMECRVLDCFESGWKC